MRKGAALFFTLLLMLCSCHQQSKNEIPADIIARDTMIDLVVESWLMESAIHNFGGTYEQQGQKTVTFYDDFFKRHHITKKQFIHSLEYYMNDDENAPVFIEDCKTRLDESKEEYLNGTEI